MIRQLRKRTRPLVTPEVVCDEYNTCPEATTCCCIYEYYGYCFAWGCCPLEGASCCDDHYSCGPHDYPVCNVRRGTCSKVNEVFFEPVRKTQDAMFFVKTSDETWVPCGHRHPGAIEISMQDLATQGQASKITPPPISRRDFDKVLARQQPTKNGPKLGRYGYGVHFSMVHSAHSSDESSADDNAITIFGRTPSGSSSSGDSATSIESIRKDLGYCWT